MGALEIALAAAGIAGGASAAASYLLTRSGKAEAEIRDDEHIRNLAASAHDLAADVKLRAERTADDVAAIREEIRGSQQRISVLESKMDLFWRKLAVDVADFLHSPHPSRSTLDSLLDRFRDETITEPEMTELTGLLRQVKDGLLMPFSQADQVAASLMLRAIEVTRGISAGGSQK